MINDAEFWLMRHSRFHVLLFLVALTIQVIAPIASNLAHAKAFMGSGVATVICQSTDGQATGSGNLPNHLPQDKQCLLCQTVCDATGFIFNSNRQILVSSSIWAEGVFYPRINNILESSVVALYQARAPPSHTPTLGWKSQWTAIDGYNNLISIISWAIVGSE